MIKTLFTEAYRILKDDGSFFYNYKSDTKGNVVSSAFAHLHKFMAFTDFKIGAEIVWKYTGNFDSARIRFPMDYEMVFQLIKNSKFKFINTGEKLSSVWRIPHVMARTKEQMETKSHPCPFPKNLVKKIIEHTTDPLDLVIDPFSGSGSTACVAKELGRNSLGWEINKGYFDKSVIRLNNVILQKKLFNF